MGTSIDASHGVDSDQFEPGIPLEEQAHRHALEMELLDWTLQARLGLTRRVGLQVELPYREVRVEAKFEGADGELLRNFESIHHRTETVAGFGDLNIYGRFRLRSPKADDHGWLVDVLGGVAVPTGDTESDPFELGEQGHEHQHIFFGSGTWDPLVGVEAFRQLDALEVGGWLKLRTSLDENSFGYRAGSQLSSGVGINRSFGSTPWSPFAQVELYHEEPSRWSERAARNSGRTDLVANLGLLWVASPDWSLHATVKWPHNLAARGGQLDLAPILVVGGLFSAKR